jgi:hypothetical protein
MKTPGNIHTLSTILLLTTPSIAIEYSGPHLARQDSMITSAFLSASSILSAASTTTTTTAITPLTNSTLSENYTSLLYSTTSLTATGSASATTLANGTFISAGIAMQLKPHTAMWMWAGMSVAGVGTMMIVM